MSTTQRTRSYWCNCFMFTRNEGETQKHWLYRCLCATHWKQTDYVRLEKEPVQMELPFDEVKETSNAKHD